MLEDVLDIPGNRVVYDTLRQSVQEGRAIAFVGAGASAGMYPLWTELVEMLADHAVRQGKARPQDAERWKHDRISTPQQRVKSIVRKLGDELYRQFLRETFGPHIRDDRRYTQIHEALLRLPFRGYVTTNYDPALDYARVAVRPNCNSTATPTWQDEEELHRWYTGDVFNAEACPILWLHGYWQKPNSIVLNAGEYADAYKPGLYKRTFEKLWGQDRLVFVGFGFNDPQFMFLVGEILRDVAGAGAAPRHIAILGLPPSDAGGFPDDDFVIERRAMLEEDYHVRPLFYRVTIDGDRRENHSELFSLLNGLMAAETPPVDAAPKITLAADPAAVPAFHARWVHDPSNDSRFVGRVEETSRLDLWVRDTTVRAIGIAAIGGTGKTALAGHWLQKTIGWQSRPFVGLFGWSFYQERDTVQFLTTFLRWAAETFGTPEIDARRNLVSQAVEVLRERALILVLDGLEVLQEGPVDPRHGAFLDGNLRDLLGTVCAHDHPSLAVLTSRFVFADLEQFLGLSFHQLELRGLYPESGAMLLQQLGVYGSESDRAKVSKTLEGHPLAIRLFAEVIPAPRSHQPRDFLREAFRVGGLDVHSPLAAKIERLLEFYQKRLTVAQAHVLSIVALFRSPVADDTLLRIARGLFGVAAEEKQYELDLQSLHARGILTREPMEDDVFGYACHPILRDHFRKGLIESGSGTARRAADLLSGTPSNERPRTVKDIEPVILATELLCDAGEFRAAHSLYSKRFVMADSNIFVTLPALTEGFLCTMAFIGDEHRRRQCETQLTRAQLRFYLASAALMASLSGRYEIAAQCYADSSRIEREMLDNRNLSITLQNRAEFLLATGRLREAVADTDESLPLARALGDFELLRNAYARRGRAQTLSGTLKAAALSFARAMVLQKRLGGELLGAAGAWWSELLVRTRHTALAKTHALKNLQACSRKGLNHDAATCHWILGICAIADRRAELAAEHLTQAAQIYERGDYLFYLSQVRITTAALELARRDFGSAHRLVTEALQIAQPRGMRLSHADGLVQRSRIRLAEALPITEIHYRLEALDYALVPTEEALAIARDCGYPWAECEALILQAEIYRLLADATGGKGEQFRIRRDQARATARTLEIRLLLTEADLADAQSQAAIG